MTYLIRNKVSKFKYLFLLTSVLVFFVVALRSYLVPFNHDETATFFYFIQSGKYMPFHSAIDANNHVLNSMLGNVCFHLLGSSPFSLRIPNLVGLVILMLATYKISKFLNQFGSKVLLMAGLLLSFHWLSFFSACRGYGLSLALLMMGIAFMIDYINNTENKSAFIFSIVFWQLAISANLILIIVVLLLSGINFIIQVSNKKLIKPLVLGAWLLHFAVIYYWLSFSFYLQENGALYYGEGTDYWDVTFASLIQLLVGNYNVFIKWTVLTIIISIIFAWFFLLKKDLLNAKIQLKRPSFSILFFVILSALVLGFYLMNKILGVNYPEDRTGLFYYIFFVLLLSFTLDKSSVKLNTIIGFIIAVLFFIHFLVNLNFRKHSLNVYETMPEHFYTTLLNEQKKSEGLITIGGHRVRELFYGFINYRHGGILNPADPTEVMQMNCDYYIATKQEEKYFKPYYDIIDTEPDWGFVILKRKEKIKRNKVLELNNIYIKNNQNEFIEIYGQTDTVFANTKPLIAEINFNIDKFPIPVNAWLVLQVNDSLDQNVYFKRYPLQWTGDDLNGKQNLSYSLITGNLPSKSKKIVFFIWNIEQKLISMKVNSLKIYQIEGKGVDYVALDIK
jgi:hypothetical protein